MVEYQGTVKWYDPNKGYGFIAGAPDGDVFVHVRNLDPDRGELIEGQGVAFKVRASAKGTEAYDVRVTQESSSPPRPRNSAGPGPAGSRRSPPPPRRGSAPTGPVICTVLSKDAQERFMFVKAERDALEIFVHNSLFRGFEDEVHVGARVRVTIEEGPKGYRARSLDLL